jgi:hypothetical protein
MDSGRQEMKTATGAHDEADRISKTATGAGEEADIGDQRSFRRSLLTISIGRGSLKRWA